MWIHRNCVTFWDKLLQELNIIHSYFKLFARWYFMHFFSNHRSLAINNIPLISWIHLIMMAIRSNFSFIFVIFVWVWSESFNIRCFSAITLDWTILKSSIKSHTWYAIVISGFVLYVWMSDLRHVVFFWINRSFEIVFLKDLLNCSVYSICSEILSGTHL